MSALIRIVVVTALAALALAPAGCSAQAGTPDLADTNWVLTAWSVSSASATDFKITADFTEDTIGGQAPVNSYGGSYTLESGGAFAATDVARTLMAGSDEANHAEDVYFELLGQAKQLTVDGDTLTLSDGDGNELLVFTAGE